MIWQEKQAAAPPGYAYGGAYRPSTTNLLQAAFYIARGSPRSLAIDGTRALRHVPAPPLLRRADNIPESGSLVVVANHYERPGLWMAWPAAYVSHVIWQRRGSETHWIAIQEWESFRLWGIPVPPTVTRTVFQRAYGAYGILAMPPPNAPAAARAAALRDAVRIIKGVGVIGLMPEGTVGATPELLQPPPGVGSFLQLLAHAGARILPVGLYEESGRLVAQFGPAYELSVPADVPRDERDSWIRDCVMASIRDQLPEALHGAYKEIET